MTDDDVKAANAALVESMVQQLRDCVSVGDEMTLDHATLIDDAADWIAGEPARIAAAREACARHVLAAFEADLDIEADAAVRATPLTPTPLGDEVRALRARVAELEAFGSKVNAIRNSIIGAQALNWSEHAYPLVAALDAAGFEGSSYPEARANVGTLIERAVRAEKTLDAVCAVLGREVGNRGDSEGAVDVAERIIRERDEAVAALRECIRLHYVAERGDGCTCRDLDAARAILAKYPEGKR